MPPHLPAAGKARASHENPLYYGYHISRGWTRVTIWGFSKETNRWMHTDTCTPFRVFDRAQRAKVIADKLLEYAIYLKPDAKQSTPRPRPARA